jgi:hypothetical protein
MLRRSLSSLIGIAVMVSSIIVLAGSASAQCAPSTNSSPCNDFITATATSSATVASDLPGTGGMSPAALLTILPAILLVGGGLLSARLMRRIMRRS